MQKTLLFIVAFCFVQAVWAQQTFYVNRSVSYSEKLGVLPDLYEASPFEYKMVLESNGNLITYSASDNFLDELKRVRLLREGKDKAGLDCFEAQYKDLRGDTRTLLVYKDAARYGYREYGKDQQSFTHYFNTRTLPANNALNKPVSVPAQPSVIQFKRLNVNMMSELDIVSEFSISRDEIKGYFSKSGEAKKFQLSLARKKEAVPKETCAVCPEREYVFLDLSGKEYLVTFYGSNCLKVLLPTKMVMVFIP